MEFYVADRAVGNTISARNAVARLNIDIPDELKAKIEARASESGHATLESYLQAVLRAEAELPDYGGPEHLNVRSREQLESLVAEGLGGSSSEMTASDWDELRRALIDRHRPSNAG
jgi:hypothetical protein